jgi:HSP20 family molecular chaperone IbpA
MKMYSSSGSVERWLLILILVMQIIITWGIFSRRNSGDSVLEEVSVAAGESRVMKPTSDPAYYHGAVRSEPRDPFAAMDAMMANAFRDMARFQSAVNLDKGWDGLSVSPTMDMRSSDTGYLVSMSIPGINSSNVDVSLDGRVLTVKADESKGFGSAVRHFQQRILLPGSIGDAGDVQANITNGLLRVYVPKGELDNQPLIRVQLF